MDDTRALASDPAPGQARPQVCADVSPEHWPLWTLVTLSAGVCLSVTTELLPTGVLPQMSRGLGVSTGTVGLLVAGYALMVAFFAAPLTVLTASVRRRTLLVTTLVGYTTSNLMMVVSFSYPVALAARLFGGVMHAVFWGMLGGYVARIVPAARVGRALTITSAGGVAATLISVPAGAALATLVGWRGAFAVLGGLGLALSVVARRLLPDVAGGNPSSRVGALTVLRTPGLLGLIGATATLMLGHFTFYTYVAPYLLRSGLAEEHIGAALLAYGVMGVVGLVVARLVIDHHLRASMIAAAATLAACYGALWAGAAHSGPVVAVAVSALTGVVLGSLPIFMQAAVVHIAPRTVETASALNASAFNIGIAGGSLLGALVVDRFGTGLLPAAATLLAVTGLVALTVDARVGRPSAG